MKYQVPADGTYYLGVSGSYNAAYNPVTGAGSAFIPYNTGATGGYNLDLSLVTPVSGAAGDTLAAAAPTGLGPADGTFTAAAKVGDNFFERKDVDLYRIDAAAGQVLTTQTAQPAGGAAMQTWVRLFRADGTEVLSSGPYYYPPYGPYANLPEYRFAAAGTYYVGVSGANIFGANNSGYNPNKAGSGSAGSTGDYALALRLVTPTPDAVGDSLSTALATGAGPAAGTYPQPAARIGDGLYLGRDVDVYKLTGQAGQAVTAATSLPAGGQSMVTFVRLFNSAGQTLASGFPYNSPGGPYAALLNVVLPADGTYYVGVSGSNNTNYDPATGGSGALYGGFSTGDYQLTRTLTTPVPDVGDTLAAALPVALGPTAGTATVPAGRIGDGLYANRDVDLFSFQATPGQLLTVNVGLPAGGQSMSGYLRVFDAGGNQINSSYTDWANYSGTTTPVQRLRLTAGGTYHVGVSGNGNSSYNPTVAGSGYGDTTNGDYNLALTLADPPPPDAIGDTLATALPTGLGRNGKKTYHLSQGKIGDGVDGARDVDLFQLQVTAGQTFSAAVGFPNGSTLGGSVTLRLFDAAGNELANSSATASWSTPGSTRPGRTTSASRAGTTPTTTRT